jgi:hypothetical protein
MQLGELAAAKKEADGRWSIRVKEHKVKSKACFVFVGSDVFSWLQKLTGMYRPPDVPAEVPYVFVTAQGSQYTSTSIVDLLNVNWYVYGNELKRQLPKLTGTMIRKATVYLQRESGGTIEDEEDLALLMAHRKDTADKFYDLSGGRKRASRGSSIARRLWQPAPAETVSQRPSATASATSAEEEVIPPTPPRDLSPANPDAQGPREEAEVPAPGKPPKHWALIFRPSEETALRRVFRQYIDDRARDPTLRIRQVDIHEILLAEPVFKELLGRVSLKQITWRIRYEVRLVKREMAKSEPDNPSILVAIL